MEPMSRVQHLLRAESSILLAWKGPVKPRYFLPYKSHSVVADKGNGHCKEENSARHAQKVYHEKSCSGQ